MLRSPLNVSWVMLGITLTLSAFELRADLSVPHFFSDHLVLQRGKRVPLWGQASPGSPVSVTFGHARGSAVTDSEGKWLVRIASGEASPEGRPLVIQSGKETITIKDVLVGEVWFAAGQSNMMWKLRDSADPSTAMVAAKYPGIRMFTSPEVTAEHPQSDIEGHWALCSPETAGDFSAVAYYYARKLHLELDVPIGIIVSAWGAKRIETFISREALNARPETKGLVDTLYLRDKQYDPIKAQALHEQRKATFDQWVAEGRRGPRPRPAREEPRRPLLGAAQPGVLFNSMIHPFIAYELRGAIWYQGESNAREKLLPYDILLTMLIQDWRTHWGYEFPFYFVQLANFRAPTRKPGVADPWPLLQDRMRRVLQSVPKTGMAVINDAGEVNNIHPRDKQTPGERLARWALAKTYEKDLVHSGPLYESFAIKKEALTIRFASVGEGLRSREDGALQRFEIAGADRKWHWAEAEVVGANQVKLSHPDVPEPVAARYAWASNPQGANLVNNEGLPASVFRTDNWLDVVSVDE